MRSSGPFVAFLQILKIDTVVIALEHHPLNISFEHRARVSLLSCFWDGLSHGHYPESPTYRYLIVRVSSARG